MLTEPMIQQLHTLRLKGMADALERQLATPNLTQRSFEERLSLLIQNEVTERASFRLAQRLRWARLPMPACLEDLDTRTPRGLDAGQFAQLTDLAWIREHLNVLITGPTGVGKSYLAAALAHAACRADFSVRCFHAYLGDRTVADAILDRLVHNSYRIVLKGESMRRNKGLNARPPAAPKPKGH